MVVEVGGYVRRSSQSQRMVRKDVLYPPPDLYLPGTGVFPLTVVWLTGSMGLCVGICGPRDQLQLPIGPHQLKKIQQAPLLPKTRWSRSFPASHGAYFTMHQWLKPRAWR
jgi:hypothetical protein